MSPQSRLRSSRTRKRRLAGVSLPGRPVGAPELVAARDRDGSWAVYVCRDGRRRLWASGFDSSDEARTAAERHAAESGYRLQVQVGVVP